MSGNDVPEPTPIPWTVDEMERLAGGYPRAVEPPAGFHCEEARQLDNARLRELVRRVAAEHLTKRLIEQLSYEHDVHMTHRDGADMHRRAVERRAFNEWKFSCGTCALLVEFAAEEIELQCMQCGSGYGAPRTARPGFCSRDCADKVNGYKP